MFDAFMDMGDISMVQVRAGQVRSGSGQGRIQGDLTNSCSFLITGLMRVIVGEHDKSRGEV